MSTRLFVHCPFEEKEAVKALGARWDTRERRWYAPNPNVYTALVKWHKPKTVIKKRAYSRPSYGPMYSSRPWEQTGETREVYEARKIERQAAEKAAEMARLTAAVHAVVAPPVQMRTVEEQWAMVKPWSERVR